MSAHPLIERARSCHQDGKLKEAEALYRQALAVSPDDPDALHLLGLICYQTARLQEAYDLIGRAITLNPDCPDYFNNLGNVFRALGRDDEALASYKRAVEVKPDFAEAFNNLGVLLHDHGRLDTAESCLSKAVSLRPEYSEAIYNLGNVFKDMGDLQRAGQCMKQAISLDPGLAEAYNGLGAILYARHHLESALQNFDTALKLRPGFSEAANNLGSVLLDLGRHGEATALYKEIVLSGNASPDIYNNLGNACKAVGIYDEAILNYREALKLNPHYVSALSGLLEQTQLVCDWDGLDDAVSRLHPTSEADLTGEILPFVVLCLPLSSAYEQLISARRYVEARLAGFERMGKAMGFEFNKGSRGRIRIGYVSSDFREHATAYLVAELFELHDRERFEVIGYFCNPDDGGEMFRRLMKAFDRTVDLTSMSHEDAAKRINADDIDILIDLKGYTKDSRPEIFALRPAPVQVNFLGYPGTMGAGFMDYLVTDRFICPPGSEACYTEKLVYMPGSYQINDRKRVIAQEVPGRTECGLPEEGFVWCCFNNNYKITPEVFDVWMRLLQARPGSVLWLLEGNRHATENLRREAVKRGIGAERLVFGPRLPLQRHLARHRHADLFLDTHPVNAHTTASDALWAGLPVLTLAGETFISRVGGSLLRAVGLQDLIAFTLKEYEDKALYLAGHAEGLKAISEGLRAGRMRAPLFDSERYTRDLERAYERMWESYQRSERPRHIEL